MTGAPGEWSRERPIAVVHVDDDPACTALVREYLESETEQTRREQRVGGEERVDREQRVDREERVKREERDGTAVVCATTFEVHSTTDPIDVADLLDDHDADCVVSDLEMPGSNGLALVRSVRDSHPDLPILLFTGRATTDFTKRALKAGVTDYVRKGGGADRLALLAHRIRNCVHRHRMERALARHDGGAAPMEHGAPLQMAHAHRERARESSAAEDRDTADSRLPTAGETPRDRSIPAGDGGVDDSGDSGRIRSRLDDAWSARPGQQPSRVGEPDTRFQIDEKRLRRLFASLEAAADGRGSETPPTRTQRLLDGLYLEERSEADVGDERRPESDSSDPASEQSTGLGVEGLCQLAREYGWRTHIANGRGDRSRLEFEPLDRPTPHTR